MNRLRSFASMPLIGLLSAAMVGCGGGGSSSASPAGAGASAPSTSVSSDRASNQIPIVVDRGPPGVYAVNTPYVNVTLCAPGSTTNCQTVGHVLLDTGSSGLRIMASVLTPALLNALPAVSLNGAPIAECLPFVQGNVWGPLVSADIAMNGESAAGAAVQIIGAGAYDSIPAACSASGPVQDTVSAFGANGIIGVGVFEQDCGSACASNSGLGIYYTCNTTTSCTSAAVPLAKQVWNPVALVPDDNNGTLITLPAAPPSGAPATGTLTFGIGTQSDNAIGNASILTVDDVYGELTATVGATTYTGSYVDSGSNGYFFGTNVFQLCKYSLGFYCPPSGAVAVLASLQGVNGETLSANFTVGNADDFAASHPNAADDADLAGSNGTGGAAFGLPFFLGATVSTAIEHSNTPVAMGPWVGVLRN